MNKRVRHILGLSGGKDSTALAILLYNKIPNLEFFFCDTGKELPETYEYLNKLKARLGINISYLNSDRDFDHWLDVYGGMLPSARIRWCTKQLKIIPLEKFIGDDETYSYIGIRADENRDGYISTKPNIKPVFPFKEIIFKQGKYSQKNINEELANLGINMPLKKEGYVLKDIEIILQQSSIGKPSYYEWRSRSGCFFCFFQRKFEWVKLYEKHPNLFMESVKYEQNHKDGRKYYWNENEPLMDLIKRKEQICIEHDKYLKKLREKMPNKPLSEVLDIDSDDEENQPCFICNM